MELPVTDYSEGGKKQKSACFIGKHQDLNRQLQVHCLLSGLTKSSVGPYIELAIHIMSCYASSQIINIFSVTTIYPQGGAYRQIM